MQKSTILAIEQMTLPSPPDSNNGHYSLQQADGKGQGYFRVQESALDESQQADSGISSNVTSKPAYKASEELKNVRHNTHNNQQEYQAVIVRLSHANKAVASMKGMEKIKESTEDAEQDQVMKRWRKWYLLKKDQT